jgi:outer membrane biosynthesis protein TonB
VRACVLLLLIVSCAGEKPAESPSSASPSTSASTPSAPAVPSATPASSAITSPAGGSVLVGDIPAAKAFDPKAVIDANKPAMLECYNRARASNPGLSGKLKLRIIVNEAGSVIAVEAEPGGSANTPTLVTCIGDTLKAAKFPKPGGNATVVAPLVFRPE